MVLVNNLLQCFSEISHQGAADTAGVHLGNVDAGILQEAAVNSDLAKLVFNQHQVLTGISLRDHFLNESGLTRTQKTGINIDFCHITHLLYINFLLYYTTVCRD